MQKIRLISALLLASFSCGCADKEKPVAGAHVTAPATAAASAAPENAKEILMKAVFDAQYRPATKDALAELPMFEDRAIKRLFVVKPLASTVLKSGETVLVAQAEYAKENAERNSNVIGDDSLINVYLLRETAGKWTVLKRHQNIVYRGYSEHPGSVLFPMLGKDKQGLAIVHGLFDEGCSSETLFLYDLGQDPLRELSGGISSASNDTDSCNGVGPEKISSINSKWHLAPSRKAGSAYDDLVMVFSVGDTAKAASGGSTPAPTAAKKTTVRYAYDGTRYILAAGKNPIGSHGE